MLLGTVVAGVVVNDSNIRITDGKKTGCKADEESFWGQTGEMVCLKILLDAGKVCTASSQCLSGKCVVTKPQAEEGTCYKYKNHSECLDGFATIEKARSYPKNDKNTLRSFRCFM